MTELKEISKKVLLLGDPSVGKTSLIRKFVYDKFDDKYISTLGTKVSRKRIYMIHPNNSDIKFELNLMIWDMMGQKEYRLFHQTAYQGAMGALIVCDTTRHETLENLPNWIEGLYNVTNKIPIVLIGNKMDLSSIRKFELEDLKNINNGSNMLALLTSAKTGENVETAFQSLGERIIYEQNL